MIEKDCRERPSPRCLLEFQTGEPTGSACTPATFMAMMTGLLFWEPMCFIMEQKMLRNVRDLSQRG